MPTFYALAPYDMQRFVVTVLKFKLEIYNQ